MHLHSPVNARRVASIVSTDSRSAATDAHRANAPALPFPAQSIALTDSLKTKTAATSVNARNASQTRQFVTSIVLTDSHGMRAAVTSVTVMSVLQRVVCIVRTDLRLMSKAAASASVENRRGDQSTQHSLISADDLLPTSRDY